MFVLLISIQDSLLEVAHHQGQPLTKWDLWLPVQQLLCLGDIWFPLVWVIGCVLFELNGCTWINRLLDNLALLWLLIRMKESMLERRQNKCDSFYGQTSASSSMVNSPGLPRLKGPMCSPSINAINPSTYKLKWKQINSILLYHLLELKALSRLQIFSITKDLITNKLRLPYRREKNSYTVLGCSNSSN